MLFLCQVNLDWSHVQPEVINDFHTVWTAEAIKKVVIKMALFNFYNCFN